MGRISHVADYVTMRGHRRPLLLPGPGPGIPQREYGWNFSLPLDAVVGEPSVIAFVVSPTTRTRPITLKRIDYEVQINKVILHMVAISVDDVRGIWRVVKGGVLRTGNDNKITFRILDEPEPHGVHLEFSDFVLWFQRRVAEAPSVN